MSDNDFQPAVPVDSALLAAEEAQRKRVWDRKERLRVIFETINWAKSQTGVSRNNKESCLRRQQEILRCMCAGRQGCSRSVETCHSSKNRGGFACSSNNPVFPIGCLGGFGKQNSAGTVDHRAGAIGPESGFQAVE